MVVSGKVLVVCIMLGLCHTGEAIKCYVCREGTGTNKTLMRGFGANDASETPCLNKNSVNCDLIAAKDLEKDFFSDKPLIPNVCTRTTTLLYKPQSFEVNVQQCAHVKQNPVNPSTLGCSTTDSWTHDGTSSARVTECNCNTDNCNAAGKMTECPLWILTVLAAYCRTRWYTQLYSH